MKEDDSMYSDAPAKRITHLMERIAADEDERILRNRRIMREGAEAAKILKATRPDLISHGPNPTMDLSLLSDDMRAAWEVWWGEYPTFAAAGEAYGIDPDRIGRRIRDIEKVNGQKYNANKNRGRHSEIENDIYD